MKKSIFLLLISICSCGIQVSDAVDAYNKATTQNPVVSPPIPPIDIKAVSGNGQISISWANNIDATSYNLYFGNSVGIHGTSILGVTNPYIHIGLTNGANYYYILKAVNSIGESSASTESRATVGVIDRHNGTVYIVTLNQTWPKCEQVNILGANQYNAVKDDCSGGVAGTFQNCSVNDMTCAPAPLYILNGSGYSEAWLTCKNNVLAGRTWRVPVTTELIAFQPSFIANLNIFGLVQDKHWTADDDFNMAAQVNLTDGSYSYPNRLNLNYVACVSDGI